MEQQLCRQLGGETRCRTTLRRRQSRIYKHTSPRINRRRTFCVRRKLNITQNAINQNLGARCVLRGEKERRRGGEQARNIHVLPRLTRGPNTITSAIYVKRSPVQWQMIFVCV